jgi:hypothetical protein
MSNQSRVAVMTGSHLLPHSLLQEFLHLDLGNTRIGNSRGSFRVENQTAAAGAKWRCPMGVAGWRFAHVKRTLRVRAVLVGLLEELPFICPVVVAVGSTVMFVIKLCKDLPQ